MPLRGLLAIVTFTWKPRFSRTEAAFVFCGPTTWNKLPCVQPDFLYGESFKSAFKTFYCFKASEIIEWATW